MSTVTELAHDAARIYAGKFPRMVGGYREVLGYAWEGVAHAKDKFDPRRAGKGGFRSYALRTAERYIWKGRNTAEGRDKHGGPKINDALHLDVETGWYGGTAHEIIADPRSPDPSELTEEGATRVLSTAIAGAHLEPRERQVLQLRLLSHMDNREVALVLGTTQGAVKKAMTMGRAKVGRYLERKEMV